MAANHIFKPQDNVTHTQKNARWSDFWKIKIGDICELNDGSCIVINRIIYDNPYCLRGNFLKIKGFFRRKLILGEERSWTKDGLYHVKNEIPLLNIKRVIIWQK